MKRNFDEWLGTFKTRISDYRYYVDFDKVNNNIDNIKTELNILGSRLASFFSFARRGKLQEPQNFPPYDKIYTRSPLNAIGTFHYSSR